MNPNISGKDSTASVASAGSEGSSSSSDGSDIDGDFEFYDCDNMKRADSDFSMVSLKVGEYLEEKYELKYRGMKNIIVSWLLMPWLFPLPRHQLTCYWLCK